MPPPPLDELVQSKVCAEERQPIVRVDAVQTETHLSRQRIAVADAADMREGKCE